MYPYYLFGDSDFLRIDLYTLLICTGIIVCLLMFRKYSDKTKMPVSLYNLVIYSTFGGIGIGFAGATLMQSIYNFIATGKFEFKGMTFYGGLTFGAGSFMVIYFLAGYFIFRKTETPGLNFRKFFRMSDIAACCITVAHGFGRLGCLMAGCCHGLVFDEPHWYTFRFITLYTDGSEKYFYALPVQLCEALFLFAICAFLSVRFFKKKTYNLPIYMVLYGIWRFAIEYLRADERGQTFISFLTPSQLVALLMIVGGIVLYLFEKRYFAKHSDALDFDLFNGTSISETKSPEGAENTDEENS